MVDSTEGRTASMQLRNNPRYLFTVDVEDWFHILDLDSVPSADTWPSLPSRVEYNLYRLLDLLSEHRTTTTMFFLGWIAERFPQLVVAAQSRGHEIASHGYGHRLVYSMTPKELVEDLRRARAALQEASGDSVSGYRAPGFSVTARTPWFFECVAEAGHTYDCSVFPAPRRHGGLTGAERAPHIAFRAADGKALIEVPVSVVQMLGQRFCFFGGGYLRLFPTWLIQTMANRVSAEGLPVMFYVHPRDIDAEQPRLAMSPWRRFQSYVNVGGTTYAKLDILLRTFPFVSVEKYLAATSPVARP